MIFLGNGKVGKTFIQGYLRHIGCGIVDTGGIGLVLNIHIVVTYLQSDITLLRI